MEGLWHKNAIVCTVTAIVQQRGWGWRFPRVGGERSGIVPELGGADDEIAAAIADSGHQDASGWRPVTRRCWRTAVAGNGRACSRYIISAGAR